MQHDALTSFNLVTKDSIFKCHLIISRQRMKYANKMRGGLRLVELVDSVGKCSLSMRFLQSPLGQQDGVCGWNTPSFPGLVQSHVPSGPSQSCCFFFEGGTINQSGRRDTIIKDANFFWQTFRSSSSLSPHCLPQRSPKHSRIIRVPHHPAKSRFYLVFSLL